MKKDIDHALIQTEIIKVNGYQESQVEDSVVVEKALTVYLNGEEFVTMVYSPGLEKELAIGFLYSEGIISKPSDLLKISVDQGEGLVWAETKTSNGLGEKLFLKRYLTSCCGKGRSSFYFANDARVASEITSNLQISTEQVSKYSCMLEENSELFHLTGGVHSGALASEGKFDYFAYDIGRHNVLDKLYGQIFLAEEALSEKVLVFSGRISSEILIKAAKMGCPIIIARSAPTDLALRLADELGITVIGFAREDRMNLYTHTMRVSRTF